MSEKYLITTSLEDTWPNKKKFVIFLGEWAKLYKRSKKWNKFNSETIPYHWDNRKKLISDFENIILIYEHLLGLVAEKLNLIHNVNYSKRFWRILVGGWLAYFLQILYDRWFMLNFSLANNDIDFIKCFEPNDNLNIPNDFKDFQSRISTDEWNEYLFCKILEKIIKKYPSTKIIFRKKIFDIANTHKPNNKKLSQKIIRSLFLIRSYFKNTIAKFLNIGCKNDKYFLFGTSLTTLMKFRLSYSLRNPLRIWESESLDRFVFNKELRNWKIFFEFKKDNNWQEFINIALKLIPDFMPFCYLEGFDSLNQKVQELNWPKNPKLIFSSSSWNDDDLFKLWSAKNIELNKSKLILGQHGGGFGISKFSFLEDHQMKISDKFFTWGWKNINSKKIVPVGNFLKKSSKLIKGNSRGDLQILMNAYPRYSYHIYSVPISANQWTKYLEKQFALVEILPKHIFSKTCIRVYPKADYNYSQIERWKDKFSNIKIDKCENKLVNSLKKTRISISTTNGTTFLDTLSYNFPTLIYWDKYFWEIRSEAKVYFLILEKAGIFFDCPHRLSNHLNMIWNDVDSWWFSKKTQNAIDLFCKNFCYTPNQFIRNLRNVI